MWKAIDTNLTRKVIGLLLLVNGILLGVDIFSPFYPLADFFIFFFVGIPLAILMYVPFCIVQILAGVYLVFTDWGISERIIALFILGVVALSSLLLFVLFIYALGGHQYTR
jgi:hypothetical protein